MDCLSDAYNWYQVAATVTMTPISAVKIYPNQSLAGLDAVTCVESDIFASVGAVCTVLVDIFVEKCAKL